LFIPTDTVVRYNTGTIPSMDLQSFSYLIDPD
jgi:hypothetical protein